jgi:hypothetical protein
MNDAEYGGEGFDPFRGSIAIFRIPRARRGSSQMRREP